MAGNAEFLVGLDIGTSNIKAVAAELSEGTDGKPLVNVIGAGIVPSRGLRKGVVINIEGTVSSIGEAISQTEKISGHEIRNVLCTISGSHLKGISSDGVFAVRRGEVSRFDIDKVIEAARAVRISMDREILHVLPQEFIIDGQDGIKDPLGMSGVRLEAKVHIVTGSVSSAQNIVKCANRCGLGVSDIMCAALSSASSVLKEDEQELGVCLLDIGGGTTDIIVFKGGSVRHISVLPVGGNHLTNDIAAGLRTPIIAAEKLKETQGVGLSSLAGNGSMVEVAATGGRSSRLVPQQDLARIIEPRLSEIFTLVQRELIKSECDTLLTAGVVLTGGTSQLNGIEEAAREILDLPVRTAVPAGIKGLTDIVSRPEYAGAVGLVVRGANMSDQKSSHKLTFGMGKALKKAGNWFSSHF